MQIDRRARGRGAAIAILGAALGLGLSACASRTPTVRSPAGAMTNPIFHIEIPVTDMDRAVGFYGAVFGFTFTRRTVDGYEMAFLPRMPGAPGASGALAKGDVYVPSKTGSVVYVDVPDIDGTLDRARAQGAAILYPKTAIGAAGFVAEIEDSEGNRIGLTAADPAAPP